MNNTVRFLQVVTDSKLSWFTFSLGTNFPIMRETKAYWIINISGDVEKKVMKSTFRLAGYKDSPLFAVYEPQPSPPGDNDPIPVRRRGRPVTGKALSSAQAEKTVTVTETQLDLIPQKRPVGRPKTGKALTSAEKQARYRARKAQDTVTVTFNRAHMATLKTLLANAPESLGLPVDQLDSLAKCVFDAALK